MNTMTEAEKQAFAIYEMLCDVSGDYPLSFASVEQFQHKTADWKAKNKAFNRLREASAAVQLAFLNQSYEWLRAEGKPDRNLRICMSLSMAIPIVLEAVPKPLPNDLVLYLLRERSKDFSMAAMYFPLKPFLATITHEQVTDEIRAELRKLGQHFAASPTGKIEKGVAEMRDMIAALTYVEGEKALDAGRGPWSQIVFDELKAKDEITRAGWEGLLKHCCALEQTVPGAKWKKRAQEMMTALGPADVNAAMLRWLALGPTPGEPREARSPIEDSAYQKGVVWCLGIGKEREASVAVADFAIACLRKIPNMGAVSQKVGFACVQALGAMESNEAVSQLTRLRAKVKYSVAKRLIEKSLQQAAERSGLTMSELEDISVAEYGLDMNGTKEIAIGDAKVIVGLRDDGKVGVAWKNADGKLVKSAPSHVKKGFAKEVRDVTKLAKEIEEAYAAQRFRLESSFLSPNAMSLTHWRRCFVEHPLLGFLGHRLIWTFDSADGVEARSTQVHSGIWTDGKLHDASGKPFDPTPDSKVRLWHPLSSDGDEVQRWRERIFAAKISQPFRQAYREFYEITADERATKMYSNRFAGVVLRQHQFASLCRARGWDYRLMGTGFDGGNVPTKKLTPWDMQAEFHVDLPPDRDPSLRGSGLAELSGSGINVFVSSDQVRFYRKQREIAVDEVPAIVYSEVMRDVDLFTSVCAIGDDESWFDQGDRGTGILTSRSDLQEITGLIELRAEILSRALPHTSVADRCKIEKNRLEVRGQLATYHIAVGWVAVWMITDSGSRWLKIPQKILDAVKLDLSALPIDLDYRSEQILRKAHVLANDWQIDSPELVKQLGPE